MSTPEFIKRTPPNVKPVQRHGQPIAQAAVRPVQRDRLSWHQFSAEPARYQAMAFRNCGRSGLKLSAISLGSWETFGGYVGAELARGCIFNAFNLGITHFDLANTYGSPPGRAEITVGRTLREMPREELVVATKAGLPFGPGPYGQGASRKALLTSIEQSLKRLGLDYVDIFYSHRPDPNTPLEETLRALDQIVRQGKALYIGLSNYSAAELSEAVRLVRDLNLSPITVQQVGYNLLRRGAEQDVLPMARDLGVGVAAFSSLAQGLLTGKYTKGIPEGSRAARTWASPKREEIVNSVRERVRQLQELARERGQTLPQMAIAWTLRQPQVTTALIGASDIDQLEENAKALEKLTFTSDELKRIDAILLGAAATAPPVAAE
ncbi:MAG: aldo/keto reductase [Chthoniobacterales bacterium]